MIEGNVPTDGKVVKQETPAEITISMITEDLKNGINKAEMTIKYSIKAWEVDEMFKHPLLKGKRPARKRTLSFSFIDDISTNTSEPEFAKRAIDLIEEVEVNPNQVTLEQAIDEAIDTVTEVKNQMQETQEAINDMLSPTEFVDKHLPVEDEDDDIELPSFENTLQLVEEQEMEVGTIEEELKMDDDGSFEIN
tara:strand:+ start:92 stop:670 length:579 start_codon:yes stop_codon:yes gene_type:complete